MLIIFLKIGSIHNFAQLTPCHCNSTSITQLSLTLQINKFPGLALSREFIFLTFALGPSGEPWKPGVLLHKESGENFAESYPRLKTPNHQARRLVVIDFHAAEVSVASLVVDGEVTTAQRRTLPDRHVQARRARFRGEQQPLHFSPGKRQQGTGEKEPSQAVHFGAGRGGSEEEAEEKR